MNEILSPVIRDSLIDENWIVSMISGQYVRMTKGEVYEHNKTHLFANNPQKARNINPGSHIMGIIYEYIADQVGVPHLGKPDPHRINWQHVYETYIITGKIRFRIEYNGVEQRLTSVAPGSYYYDPCEEKEYFLSMYQRDGEYFLLLETFQNRVLERGLYQVGNSRDITTGERVPLSTIPKFAKYPSKVIYRELKRLVIEKSVGHPIAGRVASVMYSMEKKMSELEVNQLRHTSGFTIFKGIDFPTHLREKFRDGIQGIDYNTFPKVINSAGGENAGVEFVNNVNPNLQSISDYIDKQFRMISGITGIPLYAFGFKIDGGNDSGASKKQSHKSFDKKVEKIRKNIENCFWEFWDTFGLPEGDLEFPPLTITDPMEALDIELKKMHNEIIPRSEAIKRIENTSDDDVKKIIDAIETEKQKYGNNENIPPHQPNHEQNTNI